MDRVWAWVAVGAGALATIAGFGASVIGSKWLTWRVPSLGSYRLTDSDRLWLLRAVEREAKGADAYRVAQVFANGFASRKAHTGSGTLMGFVRAYSQPVNPRWFASGDLFQAELAKHSDPAERAELLKDAYDREHVHSVRNSFSMVTRDAVRRALEQGPINIPRNATDFAAHWIDSTKKGLIPLTDPVKNESRLWTNRPTWPGYGVA